MDIHLIQDVIIVLRRVALGRIGGKLSIIDNLLVDERSLSLVVCYEHGVYIVIFKLTLINIL